MNNEQAREMSAQELADLEAIMADGDSNDQYIAASIDNVRRLCQTVSSRDAEIERLRGWQEGLATTTIARSEQRLSRDAEIKEVLEGLRSGGCWCPMGQLIDHTDACLAARALYDKLNPAT